MENPRISAEMLYKLKEGEIIIALHDFGQGYLFSKPLNYINAENY